MTLLHTYGTGIAIGEARYPDNIIGHLRSLKMRALMPYRTELARDYMVLCDYEPNVFEYRALPFSIDFFHNEPHEFMPDILAVRDGVPTLVYCQPYEHWQSEAERIGLGLATAWCMERGCDLEIVTYSQMAGPYLKNITLLRAFAQRYVAPGEINAAYARLKAASQPMSIAALASSLTRQTGRDDASYGISIALHMAYHRMLSLPVYDEEIAPDTLIWLASGSEIHSMETEEQSA